MIKPQLGWVVAAVFGTALCFTLPSYLFYPAQSSSVQASSETPEKSQLLIGKCDTPDNVRRFVRQFDETLVGKGFVNNAKHYELYLHRDFTTSWSLVEVVEGRACVKFTGSDIQRLVAQGEGNSINVFSAHNTLVKSPSPLRISFVLFESGWAVQTDSTTLLEGTGWHFLTKRERADEDHRFDEAA